MPAQELIGKTAVLRALKADEFADARLGVPTVKDILAELEKPGRDPHPELKTAAFKDNVQGMRDLEVGMTLEGVVTNVANFGAFVHIGVHQDGLVHVSQLADRFIKDPVQQKRGASEGTPTDGTARPRSNRDRQPTRSRHGRDSDRSSAALVLANEALRLPVNRA